MTAIAFTAVAVSFMLSVVLTLGVRGWARRARFADRPGGHKSHAGPVALGGGVAIFLAVLVPVLGGVLAARWAVATGHTGWAPESLRPHLPGMSDKLGVLLAILAGALVLHVIGLIDDVRPLGPWVKLFAQAAVALALTTGFRIRAVEALGVVPSVILTTFWIVLIINAFNFLDNIDGLSAGVGAIAAGIFACSAMIADQVFVPAMAWVLVGALLGFLVFNFSPASIFMGDAGSMVLGYFLAVLTILTTYFHPSQQPTPVGVLVPLVVLAVPLYDVASVVAHRLRVGQSPLRGDRRHFSHRLVQRGMTTRSAVLTIYLATAATSISAIILPRADWGMAALIFAQCVCIVLIIAVLEHTPSAKRC